MLTLLPIYDHSVKDALCFPRYRIKPSSEISYPIPSSRRPLFKKYNESNESYNRVIVFNLKSLLSSDKFDISIIDFILRDCCNVSSYGYDNRKDLYWSVLQNKKNETNETIVNVTLKIIPVPISQAEFIKCADENKTIITVTINYITKRENLKKNLILIDKLKKQIIYSISILNDSV